MGYISSGVEGYVTDRATGQSIQNANVTTSTGTSVFTNEYGYYYFPHFSDAVFNMGCTAANHSNWSRTGIQLVNGIVKVINIKMS
jgi:hypothetical protein